MQIISLKRIFLLIAIFWVTLFLRSPNLFLYPRLWAEEGYIYYYFFQDKEFISTFSYIATGNFQLLTNWGAYFSTNFPAKYAAFFTTYFSLLFASILVYLIGIISIQRGWSYLLSTIIIINLALLPQGYEVYLTVTNIQWICSVSILLISVIDTNNFNKFQRSIALIYILFCGLTGVCSAMLAPIFLVRKNFLPSKFHFKAGLVLGLCALVQIGVILNQPHSGREFYTDLFILTFPLILQTIWSPLIGAGVVDWVISLVNKGGYSYLWIQSVYIISVALVIYIVHTPKKTLQSRNLTPILICSWLYISMLNIIGSLGPSAGLISGWGGGRYFYVGTVCFLILLGLSLEIAQPRKKGIIFILLLTMLVTGIGQVYFGVWKNWIISGDPWSLSVSRCEEMRPCDVKIWPPSMSFELRHR